MQSFNGSNRKVHTFVFMIGLMQFTVYILTSNKIAVKTILFEQIFSDVNGQVAHYLLYFTRLFEMSLDGQHVLYRISVV